MSDKNVVFGNRLNGIISGAGDRGSVIISHGAGRFTECRLMECRLSRSRETGRILEL